jgi:hypothetical protein
VTHPFSSLPRLADITKLSSPMPKKAAAPAAPKQTPEEIAAANAKADAAALAAEQILPTREAALFKQLVVHFLVFVDLSAQR